MPELFYQPGGAGGGDGDMTKAVYDPQNAGKISGGTTGAGIAGVLSMVATDWPSGNIITDASAGGSGGDIRTVGGAGGNGGHITTSGGSSGDGGIINTIGGAEDGGSISTYGGAAAGGSIDTSDGGGSIDTRGQGSIELGVAGTRTTITGAAPADITIQLPNLTGTLVTSNNYTIIGAQANQGITPAPDGTYALPTSITIQNGIITAIS